MENQGVYSNLVWVCLTDCFLMLTCIAYCFCIVYCFCHDIFEVCHEER